MSPKPFITIPQLAAKLGVTRAAVFRKVRKGQIAAERVGHAYLIPAEEAEAVLAGRPTASGRMFIVATVKRVVREYRPLLESLGRC